MRESRKGRHPTPINSQLQGTHTFCVSFLFVVRGRRLWVWGGLMLEIKGNWKMWNDLRRCETLLSVRGKANPSLARQTRLPFPSSFNSSSLRCLTWMVWWFDTVLGGLPTQFLAENFQLLPLLSSQVYWCNLSLNFLQARTVHHLVRAYLP